MRTLADSIFFKVKGESLKDKGLVDGGLGCGLWLLLFIDRINRMDRIFAWSVAYRAFGSRYLTACSVAVLRGVDGFCEPHCCPRITL